LQFQFHSEMNFAVAQLQFTLLCKAVLGLLQCAGLPSDAFAKTRHAPARHHYESA